MKTPNHDNIDYWLFDWIEGNLSAEQEEQLQLFLLLNPEYEVDVEAWKSSKISYPATEELRESLANIARRPLSLERKNHLLWWFGKITIPSMIFLFWTPWKSHPFHQELAQVRSRITDQVQSTPKTHSLTSGLINRGATTANHGNSKIKVINTGNELAFRTLSQSSSDEIGNHYTSQTSLMIGKLNVLFTKKAFSKTLEEPLSTENVLMVGNTETRKGRTKRRMDWSFNKSNALTKYLTKEQVSATQRDRIYVAQERSHLDINEGFTGNLSQMKVQSTTQVRGIMSPQAKINQQISIDGYNRRVKSGFGLIANYTDFNQGTIREWNVRMVYAPKIALSRIVTLEPSLSFSFGQKLLNADKALNQNTFTYQSLLLQDFNYNGTLPIGKSLYYRDLNAGLLLNLGPIYLGAQMENLLMHQDNIHTNDFSEITRSSQQTTLIAGTDFSARKGQIRFSPHIIHEFSPIYTRTQLGSSFQFKNMVVGGNYGWDKSYTGLLGYHGRNTSILYQATKSNNLATHKTYYLHQITLRISSKISRKSRRYISL